MIEASYCACARPPLVVPRRSITTTPCAHTSTSSASAQRHKQRCSINRTPCTALPSPPSSPLMRVPPSPSTSADGDANTHTAPASSNGTRSSPCDRWSMEPGYGARRSCLPPLFRLSSSASAPAGVRAPALLRRRVSEHVCQRDVLTATPAAAVSATTRRRTPSSPREKRTLQRALPSARLQCAAAHCSTVIA